jgi:hypothetical protein
VDESRLVRTVATRFHIEWHTLVGSLTAMTRDFHPYQR